MRFVPYLYFLLFISLSGCVGSAVLQRETDMNEPFPSLETVPERPAAESFEHHNTLTEQGVQNNQQALEYNQQLRQKAGVTMTPKRLR